MPGSVSDWGTIDGEPCKVVYTPGSGKTDIYWGGRGQPDGPGHNHAVLTTKNPDAVKFIRVGGKIIADDRQPASETRYQRQLREAGGYGGIFRTSLRRALNQYRR